MLPQSTVLAQAFLGKLASCAFLRECSCKTWSPIHYQNLLSNGPMTMADVVSGYCSQNSSKFSHWLSKHFKMDVEL